jgi:plastocyanin
MLQAIEVSVMKRRSVLFLLVISFLVSSALAGGEPALVVIKDFKFTPQEVTIKRGETVHWENQEKRQYHSVWFEALGDPEPDYIFPDESYDRTFEAAGSFPYRCGPHPQMTGVVHVME